MSKFWERLLNVLWVLIILLITVLAILSSFALGSIPIFFFANLFTHWVVWWEPLIWLVIDLIIFLLVSFTLVAISEA